MQNIARTITDLAGNSTDSDAMDAMMAFLDTRGESGEVASSGVTQATIALDRGYQEEDDDNPDVVSVRRIYTARPGYRLFMLDYSQMEMRVFADYCKDPELQDRLNDPDFDFHSYVTTAVWGIEEDNPRWKFYRTLAKGINFGLIYGIGVKKLSQQLRVSTNEAREYKTDYYRRFPRAKSFIQDVEFTIKHRGYIFNRYGRRYKISVDRPYVGVNYLVQGSSADFLKLAMIDCHDYLRRENLGTRMLVQVHDEVMFEVPHEEEDTVPFKLKEIMEKSRPPIETPLKVEITRGNPTWVHRDEYCEEHEEWKSEHHH